MTETSNDSGPGVFLRYSRLGPTLSVLGLASWVVTLALYVLLLPPGVAPGEPMARGTAMRIVVTLVVAGLGVFVSSIVAALGLILSMGERQIRPGRRATRGVVLGTIGVSTLALVVAEIFRLAFQQP